MTISYFAIECDGQRSSTRLSDHCDDDDKEDEDHDKFMKAKDVINDK